MLKMAVKEYRESDLGDITRFLWTNIGLRTSTRPLRSLAVTGAVTDDDKTLMCSELAAHLAEMGKNVLLIDLDKQGSRFKNLLKYDTNLGFTDFCFKLYSEPLFSHNVADYGFPDLLRLHYFKGRTGRLVLIPEDEDPVVIEIDHGIPVDIKVGGKSLVENGVIENAAMLRSQSSGEFAKTAETSGGEVLPLAERLVRRGLCEPALLKIIYDNRMTNLLESLSKKSFLSFDFRDQQDAPYRNLSAHLMTSPRFFKNPLSENGYVMSSLAKYCIKAPRGFTFLPRGQFQIDSEDFGVKYAQVLPLLKQKFDFILLNAPAIKSSVVAKEIARTSDGALLVIKSGGIDHRHLKGVLSEIRGQGIHLVGAVMNEVATQNMRIL